LTHLIIYWGSRGSRTGQRRCRSVGICEAHLEGSWCINGGRSRAAFPMWKHSSLVDHRL